MAYDYSAILEHQYARLQSEAAQMVAELEAGRQAEDIGRVEYAAGRILELDAQANALGARASQYASQQQSRPQGNAYGLSDTEVEIAKKSHSGGTVEDRLREYAQNKQKYQHMRATGQYRDDQGSVRR